MRTVFRIRALVAIALLGLDAASLEVGSFADAFEELDFGAAADSVEEVTAEANFVSISFLVDFLLIIFNPGLKHLYIIF